MVGCFSEMRGDWKFLVQSLLLQQSPQSNYCCHLCRAHKRITSLLFTNYRDDARHRRTLVDSAEWWYYMTAALLVSPLLFIPGFNIFRVMIDPLHTLELGIYQWLAPSVMWQLTSSAEEDGYFPGGTRDERFAAAYKQYRIWCVHILS
jgi:hypothetical protein